jgi:hypothetical protein
MASSGIPPVYVQLIADVDQLKKGLSQAEASLKGLDQTVQKSSGVMNGMVSNLKKVGATLGVAFAGQQLVSFAKDTVMAASNMAESMSKIDVVFGDGSEAVKKWGASAAENMGISNQAAIEAAGTYGNLFQAFGMGQGPAQEMSTSLVQLASDMASFNNTSVDDAILALRSGLSGETEPLKKFGIALSDTRLKTEAVSMGLIKSTREALTPAAKAQASYALIMKDTTLAQGDYARTSDGTANTMKTLSAKFEDAKVALGEALMPAFRGLLGLLKLIIPVLTTLGNFLKKNEDLIKALAIGMGVATAAFLIYKGVMIATTTATKLFAVAQVLMKGQQLASIASTNTLAASMLVLNNTMRNNPIGLIITAVALLVAGFVLLWKKSDTFRNAVISMAKVALQAFASIIPMVGKVIEAIVKIYSGPLRILLTALSKLPGVGKYAKAGLDLINKGIDGISDFADSAAKKATELANKLDAVGKAADKNGDKVDKATGKGKGKGKDKDGTGTGGMTAEQKDKLKKLKTDVQKIYKDMNDVIADAKDKANEAMLARDEEMMKAVERYNETVSDLNKAYNESIAEADAKFAEDKADAIATQDKEEKEAKKRFAADEIQIVKEFNNKKKDLEKALNEKITDLRAKAAEKNTDLQQKAADKQLSIIKQSQDRLRTAFAAKTGFDLAEAFTAGPSADKLITNLKEKLAAAKSLQENAAKLAGMGYSQVFIEEVVKQGPEAGNKIAEALKAASPEATAELQALYGQVETVSNHGLDQLATTMNAGGKLATEELMTAYSQVAIDLKESLAEVDAQLQAGLADANKVYADSMAEAEILRQEKMNAARDEMTAAIAESNAKMTAAIAEAQKALEKARTEAKKRLDEGLAEAQNTLQKALVDAQKEYEKKIDEINKATKEKLDDLQAKIKETAAAMATLGAQQAAYAAMQNAPVYGPSAYSSSPTVSAGGATLSGNSVTIAQTFVTAKVDAAELGNATMGAMQYSQAVLTSSTPKPATASTATATKPLTAAQIVAARKAANGGYL